jgi:hypothetical protein
LVVAAIDRRVKCVVSQVPAISGSQGFRRLVRADFIAGLNAQLAEDRRNRAAGKPPAMVPVIDENPAAVSALPTADSYQWFSEAHKSRPGLAQRGHARTLEYGFGYEPALISAISARRPASHQPSRTISPCRIWPSRLTSRLTSRKSSCCCQGHFDAYVKEFDQSCQLACEWFATHLMPAWR